jgi:NADH-quinone oxidoreductase subunit J
MSLVFVLLSLVTLVGAVAAISLRNLVHCALALAVAFAGLAALYLQLSAQFAGLAQILVYIGAVAILIFFAILLTRGAESPSKSIFSTGWLWGAGVALAVFCVLGGMILSSKTWLRAVPPPPQITVRQIGDQLMTKYILPLEVLGLLLTAALIGAVIIAMREKTGVQSGQTPPAGGGSRNGEDNQRLATPDLRLEMGHGQTSEVGS